MSYVIEVMSLGGDLYPVLEIATRRLNGVQSEFVFRLTAGPHRQEGIQFQRQEYVSTEIWDFLKEQRTRIGGNRPYIIAFLNAPLRSPVLSNLFGSHSAKVGLAVATLHNSALYVREQARFASYYLVRYALSFVNPSIKSHTEPEYASCYFNKKMFKPEIRQSMDSGQLCDRCARELDKPTSPDAHPLNTDEREALKQMRMLVSGDLPHAIVMKGGGAKGLAFVGALLELERHYYFDQHVGTSAGAITASLLAADYTPSELSTLLSNTDFASFMDAPLLVAVLVNLPIRRGLFPGSVFQSWLDKLLRNKRTKLGDVTMADLNGALLYASRQGAGTVVFDSKGERKESIAAFAARCSMSIPYVFFPREIDGLRTYDGGLRNNFPLRRFKTDYPGKPFVGLYLGKPVGGRSRFVLPELINIVLDGEERAEVDENADRVVVIDTTPIGTLDFKLSLSEKDFLLKIGRAAALRYLQASKLDDGPTPSDIHVATMAAESARAAVVSERRRRRYKAMLLTTAIVVAFASIYWFVRTRI